MLKVQVARALTLAGRQRSPRSSTEHSRDGVDMLAALEASEQQVREGLTLTLALTLTLTLTLTLALALTLTPTLTLTRCARRSSRASSRAACGATEP